MKNSTVMMAILSGMLAFAIQGQGQSVFNLTFKGKSQTTNDAGDIVSTKLSNKTLIQDAVTATGNTNASKLDVVYVQGASTDPSVPGDFIEVVDGTTGTPVYTNLLFLYGSPFPPALTNAAQNEVLAGAQVIPLPLGGSGDSLGGATINERFLKKKIVISGSFNYTMLRSPGSTSNNIVDVVNGTFSVGKAFVPK
jgi:hypothetical protein